MWWRTITFPFGFLILVDLIEVTSYFPTRTPMLVQYDEFKEVD